MADWKPLPDTLEPDVRALVEQLRRLKDRSGLSLAALAERTLHSKSSWERYLNGRSLPPPQAAEALARMVGADPARLAALWELAARAWSRQRSPERREHSGPATSPKSAKAPEHVESPEPAEPGTSSDIPPETDAALFSADATAGPTFRALPRKPWTGRTRRWLVPAAAMVLIIGGVTVALRVTHPAGDATENHRSSATGGSGANELDITCFEQSCTGKDPKTEGCGDPWTSALTKVQGVYVELRYSDSCKAAWTRISWGDVGDIARVVSANGTIRQRRVHYDTDVYSPMVAADTPSDARACTILTSGAHGCTEPGGTVRLTPPPDPPPPNSPSAARR
ncbi:DUF2690 domain-containing protein [Streptomyces sp. NPDC002769]|uniref:helix-turn-helix domain-containing protein n=1 Tax=Streptomyces sp. NPDC002769 TaxID=3154542 RepID=UPI003325A940